MDNNIEKQIKQVENDIQELNDILGLGLSQNKVDTLNRVISEKESLLTTLLKVKLSAKQNKSCATASEINELVECEYEDIGCRSFM